MPLKNAQGRWISDDGRYYWNGTAWQSFSGQPQPFIQPFNLPPPAEGSAPWPVVLVGLAVVVIVVVSVAIGLISGANSGPIPSMP
jgi:hypothetical protein